MSRVLGEGAAIFVAVVLALVADDWRETRSEREEAEESLALMVRELQSDSAELAQGAEVGRRLAASSSWLIQNWDRSDNDRDSLERHLYQYSRTRNFQLSRAGFDGLQNANRLWLLESDSLRNLLLAYYEGRQPHVLDYHRANGDAIMRLFRSMAPHTRRPGGRDPGSLWPVQVDRVRLRHPWPRVAADPLVYEDVIWVGRFSGHLANLMDSAREEAVILMTAIRSEIEHP